MWVSGVWNRIVSDTIEGISFGLALSFAFSSGFYARR